MECLQRGKDIVRQAKLIPSHCGEHTGVCKFSLHWGFRSETSFPPYAVGRHSVSALSAPGSGDTGALMVWLVILEGLAASGNRKLCWRLLATHNFAVVVRGAQADGVVVRGAKQMAWHVVSP